MDTQVLLVTRNIQWGHCYVPIQVRQEFTESLSFLEQFWTKNVMSVFYWLSILFYFILILCISSKQEAHININMPHNKKDIYCRSMLDLFWHNATFHSIFACNAGISLNIFYCSIYYAAYSIVLKTFTSQSLAMLLFANWSGRIILCEAASIEHFLEKLTSF